MEDWYLPSQPASLPPCERALVLAPHPDDEVFGCGGCAALLAAAGAQVIPFVLTDGGGSLTGPAREAVAQVRHEESRRAAQVLGLAEPRFGHWKDRELAAADELAEAIFQLIGETGAQWVFAPSLWEVHPDHRAAAWAAIAAARRAASRGPAVTLAFYEIGAPLRPTHLIDITPVLETKAAAIACFGSQLAQQRYDRHVLALNTFRSYTLPATVQAAEALCVVESGALEAWASHYREDAPPGLAQVTESALRLSVQQVGALSASLASVNEARAQTAVALAETQAKLVESSQRAESLAEQLRLEEDSSRGLRSALEAIHASSSWRLTRPLRWLVGRIRGR